ncbi:transposase [Wolbachia endosymbiont of Cylisticus convexus]|nr:transposase [Wolbachia endosymbiont of Cylisticus convexus]
MIYEQCYKFRIKTRIPPKIDAVEHKNLNYMAERNVAVRLFDGDTAESNGKKR